MALATAMALLFALESIPGWTWVVAIGLLAWSAALCYGQAQAGVCVIFAARSVRNMDRGIEPVRDETQRREFGRRARRVHAIAASVGIAALGWALIAASI